MVSLVDQLTENLDATTELYERLLATERRKRQAIVESRVGDLPGIVAAEEQLVGLAADLEARRLALRDRLASAEARLGPAPRLRELIALLDGPERDALTHKHQRLLSLAQELNDVNRTNFHLLRSSLDLLRGVVNDVFGASPEPNTYDPTGRPSTNAHDAARVDQVM